jgi:hypothetical protein
MLEPFALGKLIGKLVHVADRYADDHEAGCVPALRAVREAGTNWLELLGPLEDDLFFSMALDNPLTGPRLDEVTVPQLALKYAMHLSPYELTSAVLVRHRALQHGLEQLHPYAEWLLGIHRFRVDHARTVARAAMGANGCQLAGCPIGVDPDVYEWKRRSTFVSLVLGSVA